MSIQSTLTPQIEIQVKVTYVESESKPDQGLHFFAYKITINNKGPVGAQLLSRHWIITDAHGRSEEVRGPGVIGLQPRIPTGGSFEYESACPLTTSTGTMRGWYQMMTESGESINVEIPEFYLIAPNALN